LQQAINSNNQDQKMQPEIFTIPVVFQVLERPGDNIVEDDDLLDALNELNFDFSNLEGYGEDVKIQFCLAQRDPDGQPTNGINRIDASDNDTYVQLGAPFLDAATENELKEPHVWDIYNYLNIWVVWDINYDTAISGYAIIPSSNLDEIRDGITILGSVVTTGTLAHEAGHYLDLYHTFSSPPCNNNTPCTLQGDRCCDTRQHFNTAEDNCNESQNLDCDSSEFEYDVTKNYLNTLSTSLGYCRKIFTPDQRDRMRVAYQLFRSELFSSLGCVPACPPEVVEADFDASAFTGTLTDIINFQSNSTPGAELTWIVEGNFFSGETLDYTFIRAGETQVCLQATLDDCTNGICQSVFIEPGSICYESDLENCELILNGNLDQTNIPPGETYHFFYSTDYLYDICNWVPKSGSPYFCSGDYGNVWGLWAINGEGVTTTNPLNLVPGEYYTVKLDYLVAADTDNSTIDFDITPTRPQLCVGLTENTDWMPADDIGEILHQSSPLPFDSYNGMGSQAYCYLDDLSFNHYDQITFKYLEEYGKHLFIQAYGQDAQAVIFVKNITLEACTVCTAIPDFNYVKEDCSTNFTASNEGDQGEFTWDFGDGYPYTPGQQVSHEYLFDGTFNVCLNISCAPGVNNKICKDVTIENECNQCQTINPVSSLICEIKEDGYPNQYLSNFEVKVPKGFGPCNPENPFVKSGDVSMEISSYLIDEENVDYDIINLAVLATPDEFVNNTFTDEGAEGHLTFCGPDGEFICYSFIMLAESCDSCLDLDVSSEAQCINFDISNNASLYNGTFTIPISGSFTFCESTSTESGYEDNVYTSGNGDIVVDYNVSSYMNESFSFSTLVCLIDNLTNEKICLNVSINVPEPCLDPTTFECTKDWAQKLEECSSVVDGLATFNFVMDFESNIPAGNYSICPGGLVGLLDVPGEVQINHASQIGDNFIFDLDIVVPCAEKTIVDLRLLFCTESGQVLCYLFPIKLVCPNSCPEDDRGDRELEQRSIEKNQLKIFPNPSSSSITVETNSDLLNQTIEILDINGKKVLGTGISERKEIDLNNYKLGIYIIKLINENICVESEKLIIIK